MIKDFNCEKCSGICCLNPPELRNEKEIKKALDLNVKVYAIELNGQIVGAGVVKSAIGCPFLINGKCSIYEDRFDACKDFECKAKGRNFNIENYTDLFKTTNIPKEGKMFKPINKSDFIKHKNIIFVPPHEFVDKNLKVDMSLIGLFLIKIFEGETK